MLMKLLYITNGINGSGGLERVLSIKASFLAENYGYQISILSLNENHKNPFYSFSEKIEMLSVSISGNAFKYIKSYKKGIQQIVSKVNPDIILVCDDGLKAFFIPRILEKKIPIIYERHVSKLIELPLNANWIQKCKARLKWGLMDYLAKDFTAFVVLTNGNQKEWKQLHNLHVIANPNTFETNMKADLSSKKVICVGKISVQKGQDLLVKAWEKVVKQFPDWELHNYGTIDETLVKIEELPSNMFLHLPVKNIADKYLESSIYVLPSRYEGFGMVLIEAMSFGIPCIAFDCNYGPSDIITNGEDGILVEVGKVDLLAEQLILLIKDEELRNQMGRKAEENIKRFSQDEILKSWDQLFKSII